MTGTMHRWLVPLLLLALGGCASLLPPPGAPPRLYRLTPASEFPSGLAAVRAQLLVDPLTASGALDTTRIVLSRSPTTIDYFADSAWTDRAPLMLQPLLVYSLENSGRFSAVARASLVLSADFILQSELRHFEARYDGNAPIPEVLVQLHVKLVRMPSRAIIAQRTIEARAPAARNDVPDIVDAFDQAFRAAARQIVVWTVESVAAAPRADRGRLASEPPASP